RDFVLLPMEMVKRRGDAHLVSDFLGLEIEEGGAVVHAPEPAYFARREQQRIGERGLAHTALAENGDVADLRYVFNRHPVFSPRYRLPTARCREEHRVALPV